jgi:protein gp37
MGETNIEWTDVTWNPVRGCSRISEGCRYCYAEAFAARFSDTADRLGAPTGATDQPFHGYAERTPAGPRWTGKVELIPEMLAKPLSWRKPRRCFVNSMSDLFYESLSNEQIAAVFGVMAATPHITYQILTKRAARLSEWFAWVLRREEQGRSMFPDDEPEWRIHQMLNVSARRAGASVPPHHGGPWPLPNVWLGVSVENRQAARDRALHLLDVPAAVHFLSVEPLLEAVDLTRIVLVDPGADPEGLLPGAWLDALRGHVIGPDDMLPNRIDWVIVGGESGHGARPCDVDWIRAIVEQCREAAVPVFVKQVGSKTRGFCDWADHDRFPPKWLDEDGVLPAVSGKRAHDLCHAAGDYHWPCGAKLHDKKGGDPAEWPQDLRVREMPEVGRA